MRTLLFIGMVLIIWSPGCTRITVTKVDPSMQATKEDSQSQVAGQRFSLPRPYIQVTPQTDGSISADIIYLPDPDHTYAIDSSTFLANNTLDVTTEGGIIKSVNWTGDSSAVVQAAITSAGNVASGILQAEQKQKTDQQTKEETAAKAVSDAQLALDQAQADLAIVLATPNAAPSDVLKAKYAVSDATLKLQATKDALGKARSGLAVADRPKPDNAVFGPKLFAIQEQVLTNNQTRMKIIVVNQTNTEWDANAALSAQPKYQVARPPVPPPDKDVDLFPKGVKSVHPDKAGNMLLTLQPSKPIFSIIYKSTSGTSKTFIRDNQTNQNIDDIPVALDSPTVITVDLKRLKDKPGRYTLNVAMQIQKSESTEEDTTKTVEIVILP